MATLVVRDVAMTTLPALGQELGFDFKDDVPGTPRSSPPSSPLVGTSASAQINEIDEPALVIYPRDGSRPLVQYGSHSVEDVSTAARAADTPSAPHDWREEDAIRIKLRINVTEGCGGRIWPAAEVLGAYLASDELEMLQGAQDGDWRSGTIVELGSGTGLVGFLAAMRFPQARVWVTDQEAMLNVMDLNHALNQAAVTNCKVEQLDWGLPASASIPSKPDVLLLADCVYLESAFQPLVDTMVQLSNSDTLILFCYQQRRKADKRFFALLKKHFTWNEVLSPEKSRAAAPTRLLRVRRR